MIPKKMEHKMAQFNYIIRNVTLKSKNALSCNFQVIQTWKFLPTE